MNREEIVKALNWRYATKVFDATKKVEEEDLKAILESGRLAPSSFGIEAWKFIVGDREKHFAFDSTECEIPSLALLSHAR